MKPSIAILFFIVSSYGCKHQNTNSSYVLRMKGSESMFETFSELKNAFEKRQDSVKITLEGGGSRTGLMAIKNGEAEIGLSSFAFDLTETLGSDHNILEEIVAYDAIVLITNKSNPIDSLSYQNVSDIYTGAIYDWNQLGGNTGLIAPIIRDENSGTQRFFTEYFNINQIARTAEISEDNAQIVSKVNGNINGVGFIGFAYFTESVNNLKLPVDSIAPTFVAPTHRNLENDKYPLKRGLRIYYQRSENPAIEAFLNFLTTDEAHSIIESYGLIAI
ncbi:MAG: substrate-binding domain-containing protein [Marinoscillum sp.]